MSLSCEGIIIEDDAQKILMLSKVILIKYDHMQAILPFYSMRNREMSHLQLQPFDHLTWRDMFVNLPYSIVSFLHLETLPMMLLRNCVLKMKNVP